MPSSNPANTIPAIITTGGGPTMRLTVPRYLRPVLLGLIGCGLRCVLAQTGSTQPPPPEKGAVGKTSYDQVSPALTGQISFADMMAKDKEAKAGIVARQKALLDERYDLTAKPHDTIKMTRGKPIPLAPAARLTDGMKFEKLAEVSADGLRDKGLFPEGYLTQADADTPDCGLVLP